MADGAPHARCHCGAVTTGLAAYPDEVTECNCSLCRSYGIRWAYFSAGEVAIPADARTDTYAWNGKNVDFHRCANCGCVTHWLPRDSSRERRGVNANLMPPGPIAGCRVRKVDGASRGRRRT